MIIRNFLGLYLQNSLQYSYDENLICIAYLYKTNLKHINVKKQYTLDCKSEHEKFPLCVFAK